MKITILGRGNMGAPLAELSRKAGHEVTVVGQDGNAATAIKDADLVVLALHFEPAKALLSNTGVCDALDGKLLIDVTNPLAPDYMSLTVGHESSAGETLAALVPGTRVVKAFNTVFADLLKNQASGKDAPVPVYVAGDDADARAQVVAFVEDVGMVAIESGPLGNARYLEPMAEMMIQLGYGLGHGADIGFALVKAA
ncbi:NADPH-dependent F420 reductase [Puniceibacterium sp. IMCC21224]|uniref:NADPH-dependent F420 reductase n=1 Tax=Puniceibacterium sp. IMCC21224 TaxID=1618204 RepID=UPI00064DBBCF|nr:NAD(P)-binding domain-containing protein [Puniceibacterium sp. IMCC21224]KMK63860.1 putative dinucleotide-binding enzyme [Puniceibacterium sp. IMCC21224]